MICYVVAFSLRLPMYFRIFILLASPVVATLPGYLFLHEALSLPQWLGILVIVTAALLAQPRPATPRRV